MKRSKPLFIARQSSSPKGILGWIIAKIMSSETAGENEVAVTLLQISDDATVLDAGTGSGRESISLCHASPLPPPIHGHALTQSPPCHGGGMGTSFARQAKCQGRTYPPPPAPGV